ATVSLPRANFGVNLRAVAAAAVAGVGPSPGRGVEALLEIARRLLNLLPRLRIVGTVNTVEPDLHRGEFVRAAYFRQRGGGFPHDESFFVREHGDQWGGFRLGADLLEQPDRDRSDGTIRVRQAAHGGFEEALAVALELVKCGEQADDFLVVRWLGQNDL